MLSFLKEHNLRFRSWSINLKDIEFKEFSKEEVLTNYLKVTISSSLTHHVEGSWATNNEICGALNNDIFLGLASEFITYTTLKTKHKTDYINPAFLN